MRPLIVCEVDCPVEEAHALRDIIERHVLGTAIADDSPFHLDNYACRVVTEPSEAAGFRFVLESIAKGSCTAERQWMTNYDPAGSTYETIECIEDPMRLNKDLWCARCRAQAALEGVT